MYSSSHGIQCLCDDLLVGLCLLFVCGYFLFLFFLFGFLVGGSRARKRYLANSFYSIFSTLAYCFVTSYPGHNFSNFSHQSESCNKCLEKATVNFPRLPFLQLFWLNMKHPSFNLVALDGSPLCYTEAEQ